MTIDDKVQEEPTKKLFQARCIGYSGPQGNFKSHTYMRTEPVDATYLGFCDACQGRYEVDHQNYVPPFMPGGDA